MGLGAGCASPYLSGINAEDIEAEKKRVGACLGVRVYMSLFRDRGGRTRLDLGLLTFREGRYGCVGCRVDGGTRCRGLI